MLKTFLLGLFFLSCNLNSYAQNISAGIRFQKSIGFYWENGISVEISDSSILKDRLIFGCHYISSRLGTAINSNAIKQDQIFASFGYKWRIKRIFQPITKINIGYFIADYESEIFDVLPNSSLLISPELGIKINYPKNLSYKLSLGYNIINGNGIKNPGTLYPVFYQNTILWNF